MSTRILHQPLREVRRDFDAPQLDAAAVLVALHEAAHATAALACGVDASGLSVRFARGAWEGFCHWDMDAAATDDRAVILAAGAASLDLLAPDVRRVDDPWHACGEDIEQLAAYGVATRRDRDYHRIAAWQLLGANQGTLDRLASALLDRGGTLDAAQIHAVARPGMPPDRDADFSAWTHAQRGRLADFIEASLRTGNVPPRVQRTLDELGRLHATPAARPRPSGLRYGDVRPLTYEHRALHVPR